jgi:isochorismate hydrolase
MKTAYFSTHNLKTKARSFLAELSPFRELHPPQFSFDHTALLVLDMQQYFLNEDSHAYIPSMKAIIPNINTLIDYSYKNNVLIIFTKHSEDQDVANPMKKWWWGSMSSSDSEIIKELPIKHGIIISKCSYDAFYKTELEVILKQHHIKKLIITGVLTHLCCETTARTAFMKGYEVYFTINGTASYNENFHRASLLNLAHGFVYPVLVEEIVKA